MSKSILDLETLYLKLPISMQQIACSLAGARIRRTRYGSAFPSLLREAESRAFWPAEQVHPYRDQRLRAMAQHCADTVPFAEGALGQFLELVQHLAGEGRKWED